MNYEPDVVVQVFIRFNPGASFGLEDLENFDASLFANNERFIVAALQSQNIQNPNKFDKSRVLQLATVAPGEFSAALIFGAAAYRHALDIGAIG